MEEKIKVSIKIEYLKRISALKGVDMSNAEVRVTKALNEAVNKFIVEFSDEKEKQELIAYLKPTTTKILQDITRNDITSTLRDAFKGFGKK